MIYGLSFFPPISTTIRLDDLARAAETHGFDSLLIAGQGCWRAVTL